MLNSRVYNSMLVWGPLLMLTMLAWSMTVRDAMMMGDMPGTMGMELVNFIIMWTVMMAAMMFPSLAPVAAIYLRIIGSRTRGMARALRMLGFVGGYILVWAAFGLAAYACAWLFGQAVNTNPDAMPLVVAVVLNVCGIYQFTRFKDMCLNHCRSPVGFLFHFGNYRGIFRDLKAGVYHGGFCTGCCAGLMLVMIIAGVMDLVWMVALAIIIFIEKVWRHGDRFASFVGYALILVALAVPWHPGII